MSSSVVDETFFPGVKKTRTGRIYCDTMIAYVAPRACQTLELGCFGFPPNTIGEAVPDQKPGLLIQPNPAGAFFTIQLPEVVVASNGEIEIFSLTGQVLYRQQVENRAVSIASNELSKGLHFVKWKVGKQVFEGKINLL
jgi:hypothetical protein